MTQQPPDEDRLDLESAVRKRQPAITPGPVRSSKLFWAVLVIAVLGIALVVWFSTRK